LPKGQSLYALGKKKPLFQKLQIGEILGCLNFLPVSKVLASGESA
jgi:hypothetical protein